MKRSISTSDLLFDFLYVVIVNSQIIFITVIRIELKSIFISFQVRVASCYQKYSGSLQIIQCRFWFTQQTLLCLIW